MRLLTIAAAMLAALLLTGALANAQEPPESETATRLEPGINLVGWVGEPTSTSQLFDEIPQLESIWAWDAALDDWIVAGRDAPEGLGWLWRVSPGMGLRLAMGGEAPFLWQRSTEPTSGLVELRTGWNLVAWSGADGAPLEQVAKGIGWSLRELRRWDAANQQWTTWTSPERSTQLIAASATDQATTDEETEPVTVRRGEALWVNTARSINWLQPTDILPRLVFPGGASDALQAHVQEELESVLAFFGQQYGIQADLDFTVYVAKDVDALIQAYKDDGAEIDAAEAAGVRAQWNKTAGWVGRGIVVKQALWPEDLSTSDIAWARYTLTHEYFHILQGQLAGRGATAWLSEGTATWAESDHQAIDGTGTWEDAREGRLSAITEYTPSLRSTEYPNDLWHYTLGWLAVDRLTAADSDGLYVEFWRRLTSTEIGPHGRWTSTPDWRTAFQETFSLPVSSFYAEFDAWQREQAAASGAGASPDDDTHWIRGRVTDASGDPVTGVFVNAIRVEGETSVGWDQRAETGAGGAFAVRALEEGDYRISVDIADNCTHYYSNGELIDDREKAQPVTVVGSDVQGVDIRLPWDTWNTCGWQMIQGMIQGQILFAGDQPLINANVKACLEVGRHGWCDWSNSRTNTDGSFAISVPVDGMYFIEFHLGDCRIHFSRADLTIDRAERWPFTVEGQDIRLRARYISAGMCRRITGRVVDPSGAPVANKRIHCGTGGQAITGENGQFAILRADNSACSFRIHLPSVPYCYHAFADNPLWVRGADVTGITLQLPGTVEELCG